MFSCAVRTAVESLDRAVAYQLLQGLRESLTVAGQIVIPIDAVNEALHRLQAACDGCLLARPYPDEPRIVVTVVTWEPLEHAAGFAARPH